MRFFGRPLAVGCFAFSVGAVLGFFAGGSVEYIVMAAGALSLLLALLRFFSKEKGTKRVFGVLLIGVVLCVSGTVSSFGYFDKGQEKIAVFYNRDVRVHAVCTETLSETPYSARYVIRTSHIDGEECEYEMLFCTEGETFEPGMCFSAQVTVEPFEESVNGFSERVVYMGQGMRASAALSDGEITFYDTQKGIQLFFGELRQRVSKTFDRHLDDRGAALFSSVFAGDDSYIDDFDMLSVRRSGASHLLAVSGMHFSVIMGVAFAFLSIMGLGIVPRYIVLFVVAFTYAAFTGFSPSVVRSGLMLAFTYMGMLIGKNRDGVTSLMTVTALMLAVCPYYMLSASFWLSCSATAGIILLTPVMTEMFSHRHKRNLTDILRDDSLTVPLRILMLLGEWLKELVRSVPAVFVGTLVAGIGACAFSMPFSLLFFGSISAAAVPCSIVLSFVVSISIMMAPVVLLVGWIYPVSSIASLLGELFFTITGFFSDIDGVCVCIDYTAVRWIFCLFFVSVLVCGFITKSKKPAALLSVIMIAAVFVSAAMSERAEFSLPGAVYSQSKDAEHLAFRGEHGLVITDMGSSGSSDIKSSVSAAKYLKSNEISAYIFTDVPSGIEGAVRCLLSLCKVRTLYLPDYVSHNMTVLCMAAEMTASELGTKVQYYRYGEPFDCDGVRVLVSELEYLDRSAVPIYSVHARIEERSLIWLSGSYFEGEKSDSVYQRGYGSVIFGKYGPKQKDTVSVKTDRIECSSFIIGSDGIYSSFDDETAELVRQVGVIQPAEDDAWYFELCE